MPYVPNRNGVGSHSSYLGQVISYQPESVAKFRLFRWYRGPGVCINFGRRKMLRVFKKVSCLNYMPADYVRCNFNDF